MKKEAFKMGLLPGIIATLCCLGPLFLIILGLISASTALGFTMYKPYFILLAIVILFITLWFYICRRKQIICSGCSTKEQERRLIFLFIVFSLGVATLTYIAVFYLVLPWFGPIVYENFYKGK